MKKLITYFFQGLLYITPAALTIYIVYIVFNLIDGVLQTYLMEYLPVRIPGLGIIILLFIIALLGYVGQTLLFKPLQIWIDRLMKNAPLVKVLYSSIRDLLSAFVGKEKKFDKPVLVLVNTISNLEKVGFITNEDLGDLTIKDKVAVYFPHSYNFSGEMFIVPREHITLLDISSSEAMKFIVSGGITKV